MKKRIDREYEEFEKKTPEGFRAAAGRRAIPSHKATLDAKLADFHERFLLLIGLWAADKYRYEWLENHTGIPAMHWQNCLLDKQLPTLGMVLATCKICQSIPTG